MKFHMSWYRKSKRCFKLFVVLGAVCLGLLFGQPLFAIQNEIHIIQLDDVTINPVTADYIIQAIDRAAKQEAECLIIELDTPGGLLSSTRSIVKAMMSSSIPVVVYVYPSGSRAGSAGVFITYASHIAAMAPSTNIGAAHPVELGGQKERQERNVWDTLRDAIEAEREKKKPGENTGTENISVKKEKKKSAEEQKNPSSDENPMKSKILNDTTAFIKAMAKERGRNIEWAESSVTESQSITEHEAFEKKVVEIVAKSEEDLIAQLDGKVIRIGNEEKTLSTKVAALRRFPMDFRQRFLNILANPNIAYLFFILGFYGLLFEVTHPGAALPGVLGTIFLILAFFSMQLLPTNYAGLALIIVAIILFIAEIKVPGFGLFTLGGLVCMLLGSLMLFDTNIPFMRVSFSLVITLTLFTAAITTFLVRLVILAHRKKVVSGQEGLIGEKGHAWNDISPQKDGKVFVHGEIWDARADETINKDEKITVMKVEGLMLKVKKGE